MVLSCEDLILHKLLAGRIIDHADAAALIRVNHESIEVDYLRFWSHELELEPILNEVWREACPDQPPPI